MARARPAGPQPALADSPPLQPATRTSVVIAPTAIALSAIRDALEAQAPRDLSGKRDNPVGQLLQNAELGWTISRGAARGHRPPRRADRRGAAQRRVPPHRPDRRQIGNQVGNITGALGGLLERLARQAGAAISTGTRVRPARRRARQCRARRAARDHAELAARAEPHGPGQYRRRQAVDRRRPREPVARGEAAARSRGRRTGRRAAGAPAQRSVHRAGGAARMGEDVPLDSARQGGARRAGSLARGAPGARGRGAAEDRRRGA